MSLRDAVDFLKGATTRNLPGGGPSLYIFHNGTCTVQNSAALASYPVPELDGTFALAAEALEPALVRFKVEPEISAGDGTTLVLRAGRQRSSLKIMHAEVPTADPSNVDWQSTPPDLVSALRRALPFVSDQGTWQRGVRLSTGRVCAINNRSAVEVQVPDLRLDFDIILSEECVAYLCGLDIEPPEFSLSTRGPAWFRWASGAWLRCQPISAEWPLVADRALDAGGEEAPVAIDAAWREDIGDVVARGDGTITITPEGLHAKTEHADTDVEFAAGVMTRSRWVKEALVPVFEVADRWNPDADGAARFYGPGLRGIVMKLRG